MDVIKAIKKYFHGSSKDEKVKKFEELQNIMTTSRTELDVAVKGLNVIIANVDEIKKASATVIGTSGVTSDNVAIALDNMRFSDSKFTEYMDGFTYTTKQHKIALEKAEADMVKLIDENPDMAVIIVDVHHDENLEKSLEVLLGEYKSGNVDRKMVTLAYTTAVASRRTDRDFSPILNKFLKDN